MSRPSVEAERRSLDRRVGMPDPRPAAERVERRAADRRALLDRRSSPAGMSAGDREDYRRTVLFLAASPPRLEWLRRFLSRHLEAVAASLSSQREEQAAVIVRGIASRIRTGESSLW